MNAQKPERVAKVIARAGICSRREAERRIADNRVIVDGKTLFSPATTVCDSNVILVDGKPLPRARGRGLPSTSMTFESQTVVAGLNRVLPSTITLLSAILRSASRREHMPARAITFATRSGFCAFINFS